MACYVGLSRLPHLHLVKPKPMLTGIRQLAELQPR